MTKILVKKSAPKSVLIKKKVDQQLPNDQGLFQTPDRGKSFMDFFNILRKPIRTESKVGVKPTSKIAALAGMGGKAIAGLGAVNETMNAMQGGNISAPLGIGYSYERLDPTGRMISDYANSDLTFKPPKLDRTPPAKFDTGAALKDIARGPVGPPVRLPPSTSHPKGELISQDDPRNQPSIKPMNYDNTPYTQMLEAGKGMSQQQANNLLMYGQPPFTPKRPVTQAPVQVPIEAVSNVTGPMHSTATPPGGIMNNNPSPPLQALQQQQQTKTLADHNAALMGHQTQPMQQPAAPVQQPAAPVQQPVTPQPVTQSSSTHSSVPQNLLAQQKLLQEQQGGVAPDFFNPNANKSFVTALTEKLGADVVYKMTPHEMGTFAAYTLLKLR